MFRRILQAGDMELGFGGLLGKGFNAVEAGLKKINSRANASGVGRARRGGRLTPRCRSRRGVPQDQTARDLVCRRFHPDCDRRPLCATIATRG